MYKASPFFPLFAATGGLYGNPHHHHHHYGLTSADDIKPTNNEFKQLHETCNAGKDFNSYDRVSCCIKTCLRKCDYRGMEKGKNQWRCWDDHPDSAAYKMTVVEQGTGFHDCTQSCLCIEKFSERPIGIANEYPQEVVAYQEYKERNIKYTSTGPERSEESVNICLAFTHSDAFRKNVEDLIQGNGKRLKFDAVPFEKKVSQLVTRRTDPTDVNYELRLYQNTIESMLQIETDKFYDCIGYIRICKLMKTFETSFLTRDIGFTTYWASKEKVNRIDPYCREEVLEILERNCVSKSE